MTSSNHAKYLSALFALPILFSSSVYAQSLEQAKEAAAKGDHKTALTGFKKLAEQGNTRAQLALAGM